MNTISPLLALPPPKRILADGQHFARVYGSGPPLLLVHGNRGSGAVFSLVVDSLKARYTLVLPDLPGHGNGPEMPPGFQEQKRQAVDYCAELMQKLGYTHYAAGGHSLGGLIALQMALDDPERVCAVVKLDSYICYSDPDILPRLSLDSFPGNAPICQRMIDEALSLGPGVRWHAWFDVRSDLEGLSCPVLQLIGESFPDTEREYGAYLAKVAPWLPKQWQVQRVPRSGHFIQIEQPAFVCEKMLAFLKNIYA